MLIIHWCFQSLLRSQGLFSISYVQLMSRCAGAGREHSQATHQAGQWKYSAPWTARSVYKQGLARGQELLIMSLASSVSSASSAIAAQGLATQSVTRQWQKLYSVLLVSHIFYYYYYYSFLCCLIKLSLSQPMSFTFCPLSSPSHCGRKEWASGCLVLVAGCWAESWQIYKDCLYHSYIIPAGWTEQLLHSIQQHT